MINKIIFRKIRKLLNLVLTVGQERLCKSIKNKNKNRQHLLWKEKILECHSTEQIVKNQQFGLKNFNQNNNWKDKNLCRDKKNTKNKKKKKIRKMILIIKVNCL